MAALPEEEGGGGGGCHDWLFPEDFQLKNLTAYDHLGQQMH